MNIFVSLVYPINAGSGPARLYMFNDNRRKVMCYCIIILCPRQVSLLSFSNTWLLPWALLNWFFPDLSPVWVQPQDLAGSSAQHHPPSEYLSLFLNHLFKNRLFIHIKLALDGCNTLKHHGYPLVGGLIYMRLRTLI